MSNDKMLSGAEFKAIFGELAKNLKDDDQVFFGAGNLSFFRSKERGPINGPRMVQIEFNEVYKITAD